ncbi:VOC family protein [Actinokineospora alba]|nr:VOC family protein [Actinokineospora alba]
MMSVPTLGSVVLDCPDPLELSKFYARLLDWPEPDAAADNSWSTIGNGGTLIEFQAVANYEAPTWPEGERPQQFHLDLKVEDLPAAHERAVEIGAKLLDEQKTFRVYADPAGHPFCLCAC